MAASHYFIFAGWGIETIQEDHTPPFPLQTQSVNVADELSLTWDGQH